MARDNGVSTGWVSKLVARYHDEGDTVTEPRGDPGEGSRRSGFAYLGPADP